MGLFDRIKSGLKKTARILNTDIRDLFKTGRLVDDALLAELQELLLKTDMGVQVSREIVEQIGTDFRGRVVFFQDVLGVIKKKLVAIVAQPEQPIQFAASGPTVVMVTGVNGSGKTTSIAKLTHHFRAQNKHVVLGACDTFRAAAVEQLAIWAQRTGATLVRGEAKQDPASVAHQAVAKAIAEEADICIVDTAGRLHTNTNLMNELVKIRRVISKLIPEAPHEVLLVLDATSGQTALRQAKEFSQAVQCTGIVLAKLDGTAKGGIIVPIRQQLGIPVKYIGIGEQVDDLALFNADTFVDALFDNPGEAA